MSLRVYKGSMVVDMVVLAHNDIEAEAVMQKHANEEVKSGNGVVAKVVHITSLDDVPGGWGAGVPYHDCDSLAIGGTDTVDYLLADDNLEELVTEDTE
jgi:hypothetical protein